MTEAQENLLAPSSGSQSAEDLGLLHEVALRTAGVSRLEMCIQCGTCGGSCPRPKQWIILRACYSPC